MNLNYNYISSNSPSNISSNIQNTLSRSFITKSQPYDFFNPLGSSIKWEGIFAMTLQCLPWKSNLSNYFTFTLILRGLTSSAYGMETVRTPSITVAPIPSGLRLSLIVKE